MGMEVDRLDIQIQAEATKAIGQLDKLISKLGNVSQSLTATNTSGLRNLSSGINQLASSVQKMSNVKTTDFNRLAKGIDRLGSLNNSAIYKAGNSIRNFSKSLEGISSVSDDAAKLGEVANGVSKLGGARIEKVITTLPRLSASLKEFFTTLSTSPNVSENIISMTNAMANLASNGSKFSSTINGMGRAAKTLSRSNNETSDSFKLFGRSARDSSQSIYTLTRHLNSLVGAYFSLKFIIGSISSGIKKSMDFVETINLFQTSYKKIGEEAAVKNGMTWGSESADAYAKAFIGRAQTFNDKLVNSLGLDPNTMMNYQAVFAQISNSMGLTAKTTENLSQSFTMLGNDIASLWNIDTKSAMEKLQSGLVGQIRPLRELGIDISQTALQLTAYRYGITESVKKMSQAEKVQLRWLTIMNQSSVAFGDMAKTINSPANQLRILKQQWDNLSRSIGNVFLPIVTTILPYINAVVMALRSMIDTLATALGYKLPDYTNSNIYTDVTGDMLDATDATDKATKANEKYKNSVMGFDELNILSKPSKSSSDSGSVDTGSGNSVLDKAINDKTASYMKKFNEQLEAMSNRSKDLSKGITDFFGKIAEKVEPTTTALKNLWDNGLSKLAKFTGKAAVDFYKNFLSPISTWTFGKALPELGKAINDDLMKLNWKTFNKNLSDFWTAIEPYAENFGQGLIDFFKKVAALSFKTINLILGKGGILEHVTKIFKDNNPKTAKEWANALLSLVAAAKLFDVGTKAAVGLSTLLAFFKGGKVSAANLKNVGKLVSYVQKLAAIGTIAMTIDVAFHFISDLNKWLNDIKEYGWEEGRQKNASENKANPYKNGTAVSDADVKKINTVLGLVPADENPANPYKKKKKKKISKKAVGGFPDFGDLFIANEAGPELVGSFGGHSNAVANNSQITDGIRQAAYEGYARAIIEFGQGSGNDNGRITVESNLYVDSEKMYGISQKGKAKYYRRNQTAFSPA